jgi:Phosphotransferase enzyme family
VVNATGTRITWTDVPAGVREGVEKIVGGEVVEAVSQSGGFSPGSADRVRTADGRRAFVKAANAELNPHTPGLYRREAGVTEHLPDDVPATQLLGVHDDGDWIALVLADVEGRHPRTPWLHEEVVGVLATLEVLARRLTPCPIDELPSAVDEHRGGFAGWERLRDDPWPGLPPVAAAHLDDLRGLGARGTEALRGDTLLHTDVRADNLLVRPDGGVVLVDWPWACRGCGWFDSLTLLINVELYGGHDVEDLLASSPVLARVSADDINGVLAGLCGYFYDAGRQPPPPGLPTVRQFQRDQGDAVLRWLARRLNW